MSKTERIASINEALSAVAEELEEMACWPEKITVWPSGAFGDEATWNDTAHRGADLLPRDRTAKMHHIRGEIYHKLDRRHLTHQLPDLILAADDGAVITMWGNRAGRLTEEGMRILSGEVQAQA